jgi:hypothetical protein
MEEFISIAEETELLDHIDENGDNWEEGLSRRVQVS